MVLPEEYRRGHTPELFLHREKSMDGYRWEIGYKTDTGRSGHNTQMVYDKNIPSPSFNPLTGELAPNVEDKAKEFFEEMRESSHLPNWDIPDNLEDIVLEYGEDPEVVEINRELNNYDGEVRDLKEEEVEERIEKLERELE